jgi:protein phosphatase
MLQLKAQTHLGKVRSVNQDSFRINQEQTCLSLADGMGGYQKGELASQILVEEVTKFLECPVIQAPEKTLTQAFLKAQDALEAARKSFNEKSLIMGSTLDVCWYTENKLFFGHVGDGRIYAIQESYNFDLQKKVLTLVPLTNDHNLYTYVQRGLAKLPQEIPTLDLLPKRQQRMLMNALISPTKSSLSVEWFWKKPVPQEKFLICSDGLHGLISLETIEAILTHTPQDEWLDHLIESACDAGGHDNITIGLIQVPGERTTALPPFHKEMWIFKNFKQELLGPFAPEDFFQIQNETVQEVKHPKKDIWETLPQQPWQMFINHPYLTFSVPVRQAILGNLKPFWLTDHGKKPSHFQKQRSKRFRSVSLELAIGFSLLMAGLIVRLKFFK